MEYKPAVYNIGRDVVTSLEQPHDVISGLCHMQGFFQRRNGIGFCKRKNKARHDGA